MGIKLISEYCEGIKLATILVDADAIIMKMKWQKRLIKDSKNLMKLNNPVIIPRNHNVENVLKSAENNDLTPFNDLLQALKNPSTKEPQKKR